MFYVYFFISNYGLFTSMFSSFITSCFIMTILILYEFEINKLQKIIDTHKERYGTTTIT